jgi:hypothetical protein
MEAKRGKYRMPLPPLFPVDKALRFHAFFSLR